MENRKKFFTKAVFRFIIILFFISILGCVIYAASMAPKTGYARVADPNTMENYKNLLLSDEINGNGTRYAGRIWSDKSVLASSTTSNTSQLTLKNEDDGYTGSVRYNTDFLHVFSTIGSSQTIDQYTSRPLDVVLLLDISSSMTDNGKTGDVLKTGDDADALHKVIDETNILIHQLMGEDPELKVHPENRVGVIVYGGGTQELLKLEHYDALSDNGNGIGEYIKIIADKRDESHPNGWVERGTTTYFPTIETNVDKLQEEQKVSEVMLADSTYLQGALYQGMSMLASETNTTYQTAQGKVSRTPVMIVLTDGATNIISATETSNGAGTTYDWYKPMEGIIPHDEEGNYSEAGKNPFYADCNNGTGTTKGGQDTDRNSKSNKDIEVQAISTRSVSNLLLAAYLKNKVEANYKTEMINYSIGYNVEETTVGPFGHEQLLATLNPKEYFDANRDFSSQLDNDQKQLAKDEVEATRNAITKYLQNNPDDLSKMRFPRDPNKTYIYTDSGLYANFTWQHPQDTANDLKSFDDIYYIDKYYTAKDTQGVSDIFKEILERITEQSFLPISGNNDNGVKDALTYMDPIGEYMEIKDNAITTSQGQTDMAILLFGEMHGLVKTGIYDYNFSSTHGGSSFQMGWYDKDGKPNANGSWEAGDTYYLDANTTRKYVSTLDEEGNMTDQQRNTVYTIYRFAEDVNDRNTDIENPSYKDRNVTFKLSDIRVWSEYTGDFIDESGSGSAVDLGYDEALYVNIPVSALPVEMARISLDENGNVTNYSTNLSDKSASTPFRLFYGVGVQDAIRMEDGRKIDISKISSEYKSKHKDSEGYIDFYSNYWSNSLHVHTIEDSNGEVKREEQSIGDANFTFSPNSQNRYYTFQKALVLYEDDTENHEDILETKNSNYQEIVNSKKKVTDAGQLASDKYYYMQIEYYVPTGGEGGKLVHALVSHKGSEFGSEFASESIKPGEFLVWYNTETGEYFDFDLNSPTAGKPTQDAEKYVVATKPEGLRIGEICSRNVTKTKNETSTAEKVYLPIVSSNTEVDNVIINGYLGNNGMLRVKDSTLEITKEVEGYLGNEDYKNEEFDFELTIPSYANEVIDTICIHRNDKYKEDNTTNVQRWLIQPSTIDILTTNEGFIQSAEIDPEVQTTYATTDDGQYYIYVGNSSDEHVFHLYDSTCDKDLNSDATELPDVGKSVDENNGSIEYYTKATFVPIDDFNDGSYQEKLDSYQKDEKFVICKLDATQNVEDQVSSPKYATRTTYLTKQLQFDGAGKALFKLKLKDGEGILLVGLENDTQYTVRELLTPEQIEAGYRFDHAYNNVDNNIVSATDGEGNTTVNGSMGNTINARGIHFVNKYYMPNDLSIIKEVRGNDAQAQYDRNNEKEWQFTLSLKFQDDVDNEDTITYNYDIYDSKDAESPTLEDESITLTKDVFSNTYSGTFTLKHNQKITIKGILSGTEYKIVENNAGNNPNGYITTIKNGSGIIGGQEGAVNTNIQVDVINFNPAERDLTIQKQVKGQVANYEANWEFNVKLVAPANFRLASSYPYIKTAIDGTTTEEVLRLDSSNSAKVTLKHGEKVTIKGLPEGTHYEVTEIGANANGYETQIPSNSFGILERNQEMTFVNSFIKYYQLSLKKIVAGNNASTDEKFKFRVQFNEGDFKLRDIEYVYPNGSPSNGKLVLPGTQAGANDKVLIPTGDGNSYYVEFELKHNDVVLFENIIEGTTYSIKEELATDQSGENGYEVKVPNNAEGTIDKDNPAPNVEFVNIRYSLNDITITKNVEGEAGLTEDREFNFRIKFKPAEDVEFKTSYPYEKRKSTVLTDSGNVELVQNADGTYSAEFTLKHDEHYTIKNIPERTQYWVEEIEANQNGYETNVTKGQSNGAYVDTQKEVEFTNKKLGYYPLTIEKIVQGDNIDVNREFNFRITFIPSEDVKELAESYPYTGSRSGNLQLTNNNNGTYTAEFTLKGSENIRIDGIPEGTKYIVEELDANEGGYIETKSNNTEGTLSGQGQTVTYTNIKSQLNSLTLSKEVKGQLNSALTSVWNFEIRLTPPIGQTIEKLSYTTRNIIEGADAKTPTEGEIEFIEDQTTPGVYVGTVQLKHGQSITIMDIPTGTNYSVSEKEANTNGFITYVQGEETGTITDNIGIVVAYKNKKALPSDLMITKTVNGSKGDKTAIWNFDIRLIPDENTTLDTSYEYEGIGKLGGRIDFEKQADGSYLGHITLKHGESIIIKGLPEGTRYEVTEREADQNEYKTEVNGQATGVLSKEGNQVEFVNTKLGNYDLSIKKTVKGGLGDKERDWRFQIVLNIPDATEPSVDYTYVKTTLDGTQTTGTLTFTRNVLENYEAEIILKHGEVLTIQNLLEGTQYTVTEPESNREGYVTTYTDNCQGTIVDSGTLVEYTNRFVSTIDLNLEKIVKGEDGEYDRMWTYVITLEPPIGIILNESYHYSGSREGDIVFTKNENGTYTGTIQIKHGEKLTINDLPEDTKYLVEELEANTDGYTTSDNGNTSGNLTVDVESDVVYTNARLAKKDLSIEKIVEGEMADTEREWTFEITLTPSEDVTLDNSYAYTGSKEGTLELTQNEDGTYTGIITLKHGETVTIKDLPEGTQYKVVEREANKEGYKTNNSNNTEGVLQGNNMPTVTFTNTKLLKKDLSIEKIVMGKLGDTTRDWTFEITLIPDEGITLDSSYMYTGSKEGTLELTQNEDGTYTGIITLKHGETVTIKGLPEGTQYKVVELEANQDGYQTNNSSNTEGKLDADTPTVTFTNIKVLKKDLSIEKIVIGRLGDRTRDWTFEITLIPDEGIKLDSSYMYTGSKEGTLELTQNEDGTYTGIITLKHGEKITIKDLPEGTQYKIVELEANQEGYKTTNTNNAEGKLDASTPTVTFTNIKIVGKDLSIEKIVKGGSADTERDWTFEITLIPYEGVTLDSSYMYTGSKEGTLELTKNADGTYTGIITLKHGEKITIKDLPDGTQYKVVELEANQEGYITTNTNNAEGELAENTPTVTFTNAKYNLQDLSIKKTVTGELGDKTRDWSFHVVLDIPDETAISASYEYIKINADGTQTTGILTFTRNELGKYEADVTLKHGETITIQNIKEGTSYIVTEDEYIQEGYTTLCTENNEGTITDTNIIIEFFNNKDTEPGTGGNEPDEPDNEYPEVLENPRTLDNIKSTMALFGISVSLIAISAIGIRKFKEDK